MLHSLLPSSLSLSLNHTHTRFSLSHVSLSHTPSLSPPLSLFPLTLLTHTLFLSFKPTTRYGLVQVDARRTMQRALAPQARPLQHLRGDPTSTFCLAPLDVVPHARALLALAARARAEVTHHALAIAQGNYLGVKNLDGACGEQWRAEQKSVGKRAAPHTRHTWSCAVMHTMHKSESDGQEHWEVDISRRSMLCVGKRGEGGVRRCGEALQVRATQHSISETRWRDIQCHLL